MGATSSSSGSRPCGGADASAGAAPTAVAGWSLTRSSGKVAAACCPRQRSSLALPGVQRRRVAAALAARPPRRSPHPRCPFAGCDALAVHLVLTNVACSLNLAMGWRPIAAAFIIMVPWVLAHWEEYHTGGAAAGEPVHKRGCTW